MKARSLSALAIVAVLLCGMCPTGADGQLPDGTITNCSCATCHQQQNFTNGRCFSLDVGAGRHHFFNTPRTATCNPTPAKCANLLIFQDSVCYNYLQTVTAVCNVCQRYHDWRHNITSHRMLTCSDVDETVSLNEGCDSTCTVCTNVSVAPHPNQQCSPGTHSGISVFNQGVSVCNTVTVSMYHFNDTNCTGTPLFSYPEAENHCSFGVNVACNNQPALPPTNYSHATVSRCSGEGCTQCTTATYASGQCYGGRKYTCQPSSNTCAQIVLHNGTQCSSWLGLFSPVCGGCTKWLFAQNYSRVECNMDTQGIKVHTGCNSDCSFCSDVEVLERPLFQCALGFGGRYSLFNRGFYPCYTAVAETYSSDDCNGAGVTVIEKRFEAQDRCNWNEEIQCNSPFNLTQFTGVAANCSSSATASSRTQQFTSGQCFSLNVGAGSHSFHSLPRTVTCDSRPGRCVHLLAFNDSNCGQFMNVISAVCGSCQKWHNGSHMVNRIIVCNRDETVSINEDCDDTCSNCARTSVVNHAFQTCSPGLRSGHSIYSQGVSDCDTVTMRMFEPTDTTCVATPRFTWQEAEFTCAFGLSFKCGINPPLPTPRTTHATVSTCIGTGCTQCTSMTYQSGQCSNGHRYTCQPTLGTCAQFVLHNGTGCKNWMGLFSSVCGGCTKWGHSSNYSRVDCDTSTQNIQIHTGCNSDCSVCTDREIYQRPLFQCAASGWAGNQYSIFNRGLYPCYTVLTEKFSTNDCSGPSTTTLEERRWEVQNTCEYDHQIQCHTPFNITTDTDSPGTTPGSAGTTSPAIGGKAPVDITVPILVAVVSVCVIIAGIVFWAVRRLKQERREADVSDLEENLYSDR